MNYNFFCIYLSLHYWSLLWISLYSFILGFNLLSKNIDVVEVLLVFVFLSNDSWSWNSWFGNFVLENSPIELWFLEVSHSLIWKTITNADVYTSWWEHSIYFTEHLISIWAWTVSAENWVECSLVNNCIESSVIILQTTNIHLLEWKVWDFLLVHLLHLLDNCERDIDISDVLIAIFVHFFTES